jgi:hypothetical protein
MSPGRVQKAVLVGILSVALAATLVHRHVSAADETACGVCHAGVSEPVHDLAATLTAPSFAAQEMLEAGARERAVAARRGGPSIPRAPPTRSPLRPFPESRAWLN